MDAKALFALDPMAAISYGQYNAVKKNEGSFEDFLLHYNSYEANEGGSDWLSNLISQEGGYSKLSSSPELLQSLDLSNFNFTSSLSTSDFLSTKADAYKLQVLSLMQQKGYSTEEIEALDSVNSFKNPLLG